MRFIEVMPVHENVELQRDSYVSSDEILERIAAVERIASGAGPAGQRSGALLRFPGAPGAVGVISPLSHDYCERCNRVRLSADGRLRLCLFGDHSLDLRTPLRAGASTDEIAGLLTASMAIKPERHHLRLGRGQLTDAGLLRNRRLRFQLRTGGVLRPLLRVRRSGARHGKGLERVEVTRRNRRLACSFGSKHSCANTKPSSRAICGAWSATASSRSI